MKFLAHKRSSDNLIVSHPLAQLTYHKPSTFGIIIQQFANVTRGFRVFRDAQKVISGPDTGGSLRVEVCSQTPLMLSQWVYMMRLTGL